MFKQVYNIKNLRVVKLPWLLLGMGRGGGGETLSVKVELKLRIKKPTAGGGHSYQFNT